MEERSNHLTVIVGASAVAEELRRSLVQCQVPHAGVATQLRGLRQTLVLGSSAFGEIELVVLCIALDTATLQRHGVALRRILADNGCFPQSVRSVGLLTELGLNADAAEMGCDVYVQSSSEAVDAVSMLATRWETSQSGRGAPAEADIQKPLSAERRAAWTWGDAKPIELGVGYEQGKSEDLND